MRTHTGPPSTTTGGTVKIIDIATRVPKPRPEPTPADLLRQMLAARAPRTSELRRRLRQT